jgi:hypothetical protein
VAGQWRRRRFGRVLWGNPNEKSAQTRNWWQFYGYQSALDHANEKIRSLELERESRLFALEDGYLSEISRIDRELNIQQADIAVHGDRLDALRIRSRDQARIKREREKTAAIPEIKKRLSRRQAAAKKLDQLLKQTADHVAEFIAADEAIFERWAAALPPASRLSYLRATTHDCLVCRQLRRQPRILFGESAADTGTQQCSGFRHHERQLSVFVFE